MNRREFLQLCSFVPLAPMLFQERETQTFDNDGLVFPITFADNIAQHNAVQIINFKGFSLTQWLYSLLGIKY